MARPQFSPTDAQRKIVETMTGYGVPEEEIARTMGIDPKTLRKHFRQELDLGATKANATVAQSAYRMATGGKHPAMTIFWLKCRAGWKDKTVLEHTGPQGGPLQIKGEDISQRITDELTRLARMPGSADADKEAGKRAQAEGTKGTGEATGTAG